MKARDAQNILILVAVGFGMAAHAEMATVRIGTPTSGTVRAAARPVAYVTAAEQAPTLDGKLDEAAWSTAPVLTLDRTLEGSSAAAQPTEVRLCRHGNVLYLGVRAIEPMMERLKTGAQGHDGDIWNDDSVEIFIGTGGSYWHFGVNAAGATYDGRAKDHSWDAGEAFTAAATLGGSDWTLEIAIPLASMAEGTVPVAWILNINRNRQTSGNLQESSWSPVGGGNSHQPDRFGQMLLKEPPHEEQKAVTRQDLTVRPAEGGVCVLQFDLSAVPEGARVIRADLRVLRTAALDGTFNEAMTDIEVYPVASGVKGKALAVREPWGQSLDATRAVSEWLAGKSNDGFFVQTFPLLDAEGSCLDIAYAGAPTGDVPQQVAGVAARHRNGQTFITWKEIEDPVGRDDINWGRMRSVLESLDQKRRVRYCVYRHTAPITAENIHQAERLAAVTPLSGWNLNGRSLERGIDLYIATSYTMMHGQWNPFGEAEMNGRFGKDCPIDRLVIDDGKEPLPRQTGLYVHTARKGEQAFYAVVTEVNGVQNLRDMGKENTTAGMPESPGEGEPVFQREISPNRFHNYVEKRLHYVRWVAPPYVNVPSQYYNWSVAVPEEKLSETRPMELHLHRDRCSYWRTSYRVERDSIIINPHDFPRPTHWYGYHESLGTLKSFKRGVIQPYTERRMLSFLKWSAARWGGDLDRVLVTGVEHRSGGRGKGGTGRASRAAPHLGFRHPDVFNLILPGSNVQMQYASRPDMTMLALWGKPDWNLKTSNGESVWDELDVLKTIKAKAVSAELPMITLHGKTFSKQTSNVIAELLDRGQGVILFFNQWGSDKLVPVSASGTWGGLMRRLDIRRNRLMPAFSRAMATEFRADKVKWTELNMDFGWSSDDIVDTPDRTELTLYRDPGKRGETAADITLQRAQRFRPNPGETCRWQFGEKQGAVTVGEDGLLTIPKIAIPTQPTRLVVVRK